MSKKPDNNSINQSIVKAMADPQTGAGYWKYHLQTMLNINEALERFFDAIDGLANEQRIVDPIDLKRHIKRCKMERAKAVRKRMHP